MTTQKYETACRTLFAQAERELEQGDTRQAGEKGWGAAAQAVKALCERRGWRHRNYRALETAIRRLQDETGDLELCPLFRSAKFLHINFYEEDQSAEAIAGGLEDVRRFIDKLEALR